MTFTVFITYTFPFLCKNGRKKSTPKVLTTLPLSIQYEAIEISKIIIGTFYWRNKIKLSVRRTEWHTFDRQFHYSVMDCCIFLHGKPSFSFWINDLFVQRLHANTNRMDLQADISKSALFYHNIIVCTHTLWFRRHLNHCIISKTKLNQSFKTRLYPCPYSHLLMITDIVKKRFQI